jgi:hypothetical protein
MTFTTAMKKSLGDVGLDLQQCLSFSTDNASVVTGRHKGVLGLLHQENPQIRIRELLRCSVTRVLYSIFEMKDKI